MTYVATRPGKECVFTIAIPINQNNQTIFFPYVLTRISAVKVKVLTWKTRGFSNLDRSTLFITSEELTENISNQGGMFVTDLANPQNPTFTRRGIIGTYVVPPASNEIPNSPVPNQPQNKIYFHNKKDLNKITLNFETLEGPINIFPAYNWLIVIDFFYEMNPTK